MIAKLSDEQRVLPWDAHLIDCQRATSLVAIARQGRLYRGTSAAGAARVDLAWVDESALALIDLAVERGRNLALLYPAPAGQLSVLIAAQLLLHRFAQKRSMAVGIVTADTTFAARTWEELMIAMPGDRVPLSTVFPCLRTGAEGEGPAQRIDRSLLIGPRCVDWKVDVLIEDHLAGPVEGDPRLRTIALFANPLDRTLGRKADEGYLGWGWSQEDLAHWNDTLEAGGDHRVPFSVSHERLAAISRGIRITIEAARHHEAELRAKRAREDLRVLSELAGPMPSRLVAKGISVGWHHLRTLMSLPCTPSQFDKFAGVPPWAPRATSTFEPEIAAWAGMLKGDLAEAATFLAGDLGELRAALDEGNPFEPALREAMEGDDDSLLITRTMAALHALLDVFGCDPEDEGVGSLVLPSSTRLNREGTSKRAIAVGPGAAWEWHRLDSGVAEDLRVMVLGEDAARESRFVLQALKDARRRWSGAGVRSATWRALLAEEPPPIPPRPPTVDDSFLETIDGPEFTRPADPFDPLDPLADHTPLRIGDEGVEEQLARQDQEGRWSTRVSALEVQTGLGRIRLEVGRPVEVRVGSRILDKYPKELKPGDYLLVGRRRGRLGLLEALEESLRHRRPDLLAGRMVIERYHQAVRTKFAASGLTVTDLHRRLVNLGCDKTVQAVRSWVELDGILAPRDEEDLRRLDRVLELGLDNLKLEETFAAVQHRRTFRRAAGRALAEAARRSTAVRDESRVDADTGLSIADLRDAVLEAKVLWVSDVAHEIPLAEVGQLVGS